MKRSKELNGKDAICEIAYRSEKVYKRVKKNEKVDLSIRHVGQKVSEYVAPLDRACIIEVTQNQSEFLLRP